MSLKKRFVVDPDAVLMLARLRPGLVKLDQGALGEAMGIHRSHVSRLLSGMHTPNEATVAAMALALDVPPDKAEDILLKLVTEEAEA